MEAQMGMKLGKQVHQFDGLTGMEVERTVENTHIADTALTDADEPPADFANREHTDRVAHSTDTEGACVETPTGSLHLHKGLVPREQRTLFGREQFVKGHHAGKTTVMVCFVRR